MDLALNGGDPSLEELRERRVRARGLGRPWEQFFISLSLLMLGVHVPQFSHIRQSSPAKIDQHIIMQLYIQVL